MKTLEEIKEKLREIKLILKEKYGVVNIQIFGSYARNEQTPESDLDLIVKLEKPLGFAFIDLCDFLEETFQIKVDVLTIKAVESKFIKYIQGDLVNV